MEMYRKNIDTLRGILGDADDRIQMLDAVEYTENDVYENEQKVIMVAKQQGQYAMNSRNSEMECQLFTRNIDFHKDNMILIYGMANVALLKYIVEQSSQASKILVFETDKKVMKYCLEHYDYTFLAESGNILIIFSEQYDGTVDRELQVVEYMGFDNLVYNMHIVMLPNFHGQKEFVHKSVKRIKGILVGQIQKYGNSIEDNFKGFRNNYKNIKEYMTCNGIDEIRGKFEGYPAIVVASGPSLEKNIKHIKKAAGKALVIACDASVDACKAHGVVPDAVTSIERVWETYGFYYKEKEFDKDMVLIGPTVLWPRIFRDYPGKKIIMTKLSYGGDKIISDLFPRVQHEEIGMSSAHVAFTAAAVAGCNPIILVGQDLAFTDNRIHSDVTHTEFEGDNDDRKFDGNYVEDVYGNPVKTNKIYNWFRSWFELQCILLRDKLQVIDATEGGARIKGTTVMSFEEAIKKYCVKEKERKLVDCLEDVHVEKSEIIQKYREVLDYLGKEQEVLSNIQKNAEEYYGELEEIYDKDIMKMSKQQLIDSVTKMQRGDRMIQDIGSHESLYIYFQQIIKQTISHVKAIGNELTNENVLENLKLHGNLMGMIKNSCDYIQDEYGKMVDFVKQLLEELE